MTTKGKDTKMTTSTLRNPELIEAAIFTVEAIRQALIDDDIDVAADTLRTAQNCLGAALAAMANPEPPSVVTRCPCGAEVHLPQRTCQRCGRDLADLCIKYGLDAYCPECGRRMFFTGEGEPYCAASGCGSNGRK